MATPEQIKHEKGGSSNTLRTFNISILLLCPLALAIIYQWSTAPLCTSLYGIDQPVPVYNASTPYKPEARSKGSVMELRFAIIADLDTSSKSETNLWFSLYRIGTLTLDRSKETIEVRWEAEARRLQSTFAQNGRAMELSDLKIFNGQLISVDDRTGLLYVITNSTSVPWIYLADGNGQQLKSFKGEWMAVKNDKLHVGSIGKEWTSIDGQYENDDPMWIKIVHHNGYVKHVNWKEPYLKLRRAVGIEYPGYMIHESAQWSDIHCQWFFLPRRASNESYSEAADERRATNILLRADSCFSKVTVTTVGPKLATRGFAAFQFIPFTDDNLIAAVKSEEVEGTVSSFITVFRLDGKVLLKDTEIPGKVKYEGIEFV